MNLRNAIAILAHARRDAADAVPILLRIARFAHVLREPKNRDDSIESSRS